jgi:hypothetical protein
MRRWPRFVRLFGFGSVLLFASAALLARAGEAEPYFDCGGDVLQCSWEAKVELGFSRTFSGTYRHGEPYDVLTIDPAGRGETLEGLGISLGFRFTCSCAGYPLEGIPADAIVLYSHELCLCVPWTAARPTDADGRTEFHGTIRGGGCATSLDLYVDGVYMATAPIKTNSPDTRAASPCFVDNSDLMALAARMGRPSRYGICFDYNEDGAVDSSDLAFFAAALGRACS